MSLQLEDNLKAIEVVKKLTPEILKEIDDIVHTKPEPAPPDGRCMLLYSKYSDSSDGYTEV